MVKEWLSWDRGPKTPNGTKNAARGASGSEEWSASLEPLECLSHLQSRAIPKVRSQASTRLACPSETFWAFRTARVKLCARHSPETVPRKCNNLCENANEIEKSTVDEHSGLGVFTLGLKSL